MKRISVFSIFLLILSGLFSSSALAQDQGSVRGQLGGVVVDPTGAIIQGATITVTGPTGSGERMSNESGEFNFPGLIPGFYDVKVSKDGFKATTVQKVEVLINKISTIRVALELGAVTQTVEVVATAVSVEDQSTAVTTDIADTVYNNLPLGRSITSTFYLSPGVASGLGTGALNPAISGGTGLENAYIADGILLNDSAFGGLGVYQRRYGGIGVGINSSFVKEVQVSTAAFGPQYGHSTGGVINMVTKSGGNAFHGVVGGYFQERGMVAPYKNQDDFGTVNQIGRELAPQANEGDFELGGYVPLGFLKNHLFFFGAFNPTWNANFVEPVPTSGLYTLTNGQIERKDTIWDYSAKLTWQLNSNHSIEASVFGDPTHSNYAPWSTLNIDNTTTNSTQMYGSRNLAVRYNGIFGSSLVVDAAFTMNWNQFSESPASIPEIQDFTQSAGLAGVNGGPAQRGVFRAQGFGFLETYDSNTKGIQFDVHKEFSFMGQHHTISVGYNWQFPTYVDASSYTGGKFAIPTVNETGGSYLSTSIAPKVAGQSAEVLLYLELVPTADQASCTLCPYMNVPGYSTPQQVYMDQDRGLFSGFNSNNSIKNHAAYINDSWEMSKYATLEAGLRWEQERLTSTGISQLINDQWDPRIGFTVDPKGDRKSKIYANFGRYAWIMPLDAGIREIGGQQQLNGVYYAPPSTLVNGKQMVTLNSNNTVNFDPTLILNDASGGISASPTYNGEVPSNIFQSGIRMEYNDEFVVGAEHEFRGGITVSARYIDRRVKRIIEDFGGVSIEQAEVGQGQFYAIGNPNSKTDVVVNPNEVTFPGIAASSTTAFQNLLSAEQLTPSSSNQAMLQAYGVPATCFDSNNSLSAIVPNLLNTFGSSVGGACFPSVNDTSTWSMPNPACGGASQPACGTAANPTLVNATGALFGGEAGSSCPGSTTACDGKPDGYLDPVRNYEAVEIEINKSFSHNWSLISNWRISRLRGNFEGAYRNDNGQNDPGISSLYDFTPGLLGLIGDQLSVGPLNADRLHIVNIYPTYIFDKGKLKGLVVTPGVKIQSGVPLTTLASNLDYNTAGEIPLYGRGDLGRTPVTGTVDVHLEYPWKLSETKSLHFSIDMLNIADTRRNLEADQDVDVAYGVANADFKKPGGAVGVNLNAAGQNLVSSFVQPFTARFHVAFNF